jgi:N-dimethylarginine dimethylaminohydrolase
MGYVVVPIAHRSLHFTTECGFFGPSPRDGRPVVTVTPAMLDIDLDALRQLRVFGEPVDIVTLPETELMSGNGLGFSGQAIVQKGFPTVAEQLHRRGFNVQAVDFSAFQQVDGGPSCLCVLCDNPMTLL